MSVIFPHFDNFMSRYDKKEAEKVFVPQQAAIPAAMSGPKKRL